MTAINVTPAQWEALQAGCPVLVVPGEFVPNPNHNAGIIGRTEPPADLVRAAEGKCETCGGLKTSAYWDGGYGKWIEVGFLPCSVCLGSGRPRVDLVMDCLAGCTDGYWRDREYDTIVGRCDYGCSNGKRTVGSVVVQAVVPIVDGETDNGHTMVVAAYADDLELWRPDDGNEGTSTYLTRWLPVLAPDGPESIVGQFALILDDVRAL